MSGGGGQRLNLVVVAALVLSLFFWGIYTLHTVTTRSDDGDAVLQEQLRIYEARRNELDSKLDTISEQIRVANKQLRDLNKAINEASVVGRLSTETNKRAEASEQAETASVATATQQSAKLEEVYEAAVGGRGLSKATEKAALEVLPRLHRIQRALRQHQYSSTWVHRKTQEAFKELEKNPSSEAAVQKAKKHFTELVENNVDDLLADELDIVFQSTLYGIEITEQAQWLRDLVLEDIYYVQYPSLLKRFNYERRGLEAARAAAAKIDVANLDAISKAACNERRFIVCDLSKSCGFGCQMHHLAYCLMTAYGSNRTLVLDSKGWVYAGGGGWTAVFDPVGECSTEYSGGAASYFSQNRHDAKSLHLPIIDSGASEYAPSAIPDTYHEILVQFHSNPPVWWVGQFESYLMRPNTDMKAFLKERRELMGWSSPGVGLQVRRTDKIGTEAQFHHLEEYMGPAEFYIDTHLQAQPKKNIFLASDDPSVFVDAKSKYSQYNFCSDSDTSQVAAVQTRYSIRSLKGIIADVLFLSEADFLVCTFSSQVCRLAFEIMQGRFVDGSWRYTSLDDPWYYGGGQRELLQIWSKPSVKRGNEFLELEVGDVIENHARNDGFFWKGFNRRTQKTALYPAILAEPAPKHIEFPDYPGLKKDGDIAP